MEEGREVVPLTDKTGAVVSYAVIHETPTAVDHAYNLYRHSDTVFVQEDHNTKELQNALNKVEDSRKYAQDEEHSY